MSWDRKQEEVRREVGEENLQICSRLLSSSPPSQEQTHIAFNHSVPSTAKMDKK